MWTKTWARIQHDRHRYIFLHPCLASSAPQTIDLGSGRQGHVLRTSTPLLPSSTAFRDCMPFCPAALNICSQWLSGLSIACGHRELPTCPSTPKPGTSSYGKESEAPQSIMKNHDNVGHLLWRSHKVQVLLSWLQKHHLIQSLLGVSATIPAVKMMQRGQSRPMEAQRGDAPISQGPRCGLGWAWALWPAAYITSWRCCEDLA